MNYGRHRRGYHNSTRLLPVPDHLHLTSHTYARMIESGVKPELALIECRARSRNGELVL